VKPEYHGSEPPDIRSYAAIHETFPRETTGIQSLGDSQMANHRALGRHVIDKICRGRGEVVPACAGETSRSRSRVLYRYLRDMCRNLIGAISG
jgi:hypothetical protein